MSDIFREVDEDLRQERLKAFWNTHGWLVIIAAAGIVLGVAAVRGYQSWDRSRAGEAGARYSEAIELLQGDERDQGREILAGLAEGSYGSYPTLARLREAAALTEAGDDEGAVALYDQVSADGGVDAMLRDVARIRAALILVDTEPSGAIRDRVGALADAADGPWRHSARELIALALYREGDLAGADAEYDRIMGDPAAPVGLRGRAEMMRTLIAPHLAASDG